MTELPAQLKFVVSEGLPEKKTIEPLIIGPTEPHVEGKRLQSKFRIRIACVHSSDIFNWRGMIFYQFGGCAVTHYFIEQKGHEMEESNG